MGKHNTSIAGDLTTLPAPNPSTPEATRPARPLRIVKIGSEGIAIKPDTGDLKTDMQTVAMCGLDEKLALMFAAAPDMLAALKAAHKLLTKEHFDSSDALADRCAEIGAVCEKAISKAGTQ